MSTKGSIADYELVHWLARGGSADVYAVKHPLIQRPLALKLAHRHDAHFGSSRFARELQILSQLDIEGFAQAYDVGRTDDGRDWLVLDRIDGLAPRDWAAAVGAPGSPRRRQKIATLGAKLARALAALHGHGLIHGDVKPQNIRVAIGGAPTLFDLGAALDLEAPISWTRFGAGLGTNRYAPPEVTRRAFSQIGPAADVFALGATLTELLGETPDGPLGDLLAELGRDDPDERPDAATTAARLFALGEAPPTFAPLTPLLAAYHDAMTLGRGFLVDAPPGRGFLVEGARGSGVAHVLAQLDDDAADLGHQRVSFAQIGLDGVLALSKAHLTRAHVVIVDDLSAIDTDTRRALEGILADATERWAPIVLVCGHDTRIETPGPTTLGRRLQLLTARLRVGPDDYTHAVGDAVRGRVWSSAFGPRWVDATVGQPKSANSGNASIPLDILRSIAWPIPRAALAAVAKLDDLAFVDALRELVANDLIDAVDGQLRAVGAVTAIRGPAIDWAAGDTFVQGHAKIAWLVASGRIDDALHLLDGFAPPPTDNDPTQPTKPADPIDAELLEILAPRLADLPENQTAHVARLIQAWRDTLDPTGPLGAHGAEPIWALRAQGRLSEARALATQTLTRTHHVATKVATALALAQLCDDLGTRALARYYRALAAHDAALVGADLQSPLPFGLPDELAHALRRDARRATELLKTIARHLDDHDRFTLGLRPEIVSLRVRNP